jgi:hypothetical protein
VFFVEDLFRVIGTSAARARATGATREFGEMSNAIGGRLAHRAFRNTVADANVHGQIRPQDRRII